MKAVDDLQTGLGNGRHQLLKEKKKKSHLSERKGAMSRLTVESTN